VKDVQEVLRQKEEACARLRQEIEALRFVAPLLEEDGDLGREERERGSAAGATQAVTSEQESLREAVPEPSQGGREESERERKGPLSASLNESSWWKRKSRG